MSFCVHIIFLNLHFSDTSIYFVLVTIYIFPPINTFATWLSISVSVWLLSLQFNKLFKYNIIPATTHRNHNNKNTQQLPPIHPRNYTTGTDLHNTSSSFSLYNESETYIPFSALKTEYQRQYGTTKPSPRPPLRRRSTSLKLPSARVGRAVDGDDHSGDIADADLPNLAMGESEQHSEYHSYTEDELSKYGLDGERAFVPS